VEGHTITGFIDRIDRVGSPESTDGLAIVDYKTGGSAKSVAETSDDLQLAVYHLAATLDPDLAALGPVRSLALDFLAVDKQVMQPITEDHLQRTIARISEVATRMLAEETTPSVHASCDYCDFARLCDLQSQGRPVPVRIIGTERGPT
jgi:RecB family exonuclease